LKTKAVMLDVTHKFDDLAMSQKYKDKRTERFARGERIKEFQAFERQAYKRLEILESAPNKQALMALPSNHFEALGGDRMGQYSIRINDKWRICFEWLDQEDDPFNIEIVNYH
ncbi:MAG TPA: type II toxin-antitoxin system RelE/ParE family toxin, partial [Allocoleopsis sp.]